MNLKKFAKIELSRRKQSRRLFFPWCAFERKPAPVDRFDCPKYVFERIQEERNRFEFAKDDEFWICIDRDRWTAEDHIKNLTQVLQQCKQSNIQIAFCNPCIEFWLLLHFLDPKLDQCLSCSSVTASLKKIASGYSKTLVSRQPITSEMVNEACLRAKSLDPAGEALPASPAANVYLIIESIKCRIRDDIHLH